ncbi:hypothetical protein ES703_87498 [subsurface metagenome]
MTRAEHFKECLDYVQYKVSHYPFRRDQAYCFVVRGCTLALVNRRFLRQRDYILHAFHDSGASDVLLERLDVNIAIVATDYIIEKQESRCPLIHVPRKGLVPL